MVTSLIAPPLTISRQELALGFEAGDAALHAVEEAM
jgi:hypothetical protein